MLLVLMKIVEAFVDYQHHGYWTYRQRHNRHTDIYTQAQTDRQRDA